jgi:predicted nucleic acid-binding protein
LDRVFLDANLLYSAAYKPHSRLLRLWELPDLELLTCDLAANEAMRNLSEDRPTRVRELERLLARTRVAATPTHLATLPAGIDLPINDRRILLAAIHATATHFLTGNTKHFGRHYGRHIGRVLILPPSDYPSTERD